jgi:G3E family GTPase
VRIDTMVSVVDASRFSQLMSSAQLPGHPRQQKGQQAVQQGEGSSTLDAEDARPLAELLAEQVSVAFTTGYHQDTGSCLCSSTASWLDAHLSSL